MRIAVRIFQIIVAALFILSGLVKANDPMGLSYKMQEFFWIMEWWIGQQYFLFEKYFDRFIYIPAPAITWLIHIYDNAGNSGRGCTIAWMDEEFCFVAFTVAYCVLHIPYRVCVSVWQIH